MARSKAECAKLILETLADVIPAKGTKGAAYEMSLYDAEKDKLLRAGITCSELRNYEFADNAHEHEMLSVVFLNVPAIYKAAEEFRAGGRSRTLDSAISISNTNQ